MAIQWLLLLLVSCSGAPSEATPAPTADAATPTAAPSPAATTDPSPEDTARGGRLQTMTASAYGRSGRYAMGSWDGTVRFQRAEGAAFDVYDGLTEEVSALAFDPQGVRLAAVSRNGDGRIWAVPDGRELARLDGHEDSVDSVVWSPDGDRLFTGSWDGTVRTWNAESGKQVARIDAHDEGVAALALSPDADRILSGSQDKTATLWTADGQRLRSLMPHAGAVYAAAFSKNGQRFATAGRDGHVFVYASEHERMLADLDLGEPALAVWFDGSATIAASGWSGEVVRWRIEDGAQVPSAPGSPRILSGSLRVP